ncbi:MAG TPA: sulfite exporter TauE/SafE family protein [Actinobacteria bacterium]|nr:sulfite exporter TauE/SafE family protein [Actinomycetota bacterium]
MSVNPALTLGSFLVAIMVGLTGMGGGALLTPMLMLVFGVPPLAAVSSDLVVSAITKPVGALVHLRRGTVNLSLAGWLSIGSVPSAFLGGLLGWWLGPGGRVQTVTARATGIVLLIAAVGIGFRAFQALLARGGTGQRSPREQASGPALATEQASAAPPFVMRKLPTLLIGIVVGLAVGVTSTGSGTLVIAGLAALYPALPPNRLVGTDLAQAVPMVLAAALAHLIAGDVQMNVTAPLLIGGIPGVIIGSLLASRAPGTALRPVLGVVILGSGLSLLGLSPATLAVVLVCVAAGGAGFVITARSRRASQPASTEQMAAAQRRPVAQRQPAEDHRPEHRPAAGHRPAPEHRPAAEME